ncbi:MAG: BA14K family protein [Alphaproteobacteria bacterium]|nr:BA14K family protein [Alphaproteobacteria bacterium]
MTFRLCAVLGMLMASAGLAHADASAYCAAYATDFANAQAKEKATWQHKYTIALEGCLSSANPVQPAKPAAASPKPKPALQKPQVQAQAQVSAPPPKPAAAIPIGRPAPGSKEWNDYCANKYTSFNPDTGMYRSYTGVDRKCLFTNP